MVLEGPVLQRCLKGAKYGDRGQALKSKKARELMVIRKSTVFVT